MMTEVPEAETTSGVTTPAGDTLAEAANVEERMWERPVSV